MPKVHKQVARKDYPNKGIKKGDTYYRWSLRPGGRGRGITYMSLTYPKPQQLTNSDFMRSVYDINDQIAAVEADNPGDFESARDEIAQAIRDLGNEQQEKLDNMPEGLQSGPTGEMLQSRVDGCEQWASDVENVSVDDWDDDGDAEDNEAAMSAAIEALGECEYSGD